MMRSRLLSFAFAAAPVLVAGCSSVGESASGAQQAPAQPSPEQVLMERGLTSLYSAHDPIAAESTFREILARNPAHYGAHYQLAVALDRAGKPVDARPMWTELLRLAENAGDGKTAGIARSRLAEPDTVGAVTLMNLGLTFLRRGDPSAAAEEFRKVLKRKPAHYGANYQLALALDRTGRRAEARPYWEHVLGLAESFKDEPTAATARRRLNEKP